jgi:hypothetical protein
MQWQRCDSSGGACSAISGASASSYSPVSADATHTLRVVVTASNAYGSAVASSNPTAVVTQASAPPAPSGNVTWAANLESGTFSEFDSIQQAVTGRASVVGSATGLGGPAAARSGSDFFQCRVASGDNVYGGERCEALHGNIGAQNGADQYYGWSIAMPANMPANGLTGQFHSNSGLAAEGQANIQFAIDYGQLGWVGSSSNPHWIIGANGCTGSNGQYANLPCSKAWDLGPLSTWKGVGWVDVVMHIVWSDAANGTLELWMKKAGSSTYTKYVSAVGNVANLYQGYSAYLKLGLNRTQSSGLPDAYVWYDNVRSGTTFAAVDPSS